jgi:hypothetical protein
MREGIIASPIKGESKEVKTGIVVSCRLSAFGLAPEQHYWDGLGQLRLYHCYHGNNQTCFV